VQDDSEGDDVDYEESVALSKAEVLSTSYVVEASISSGMNIGDDNIVTPLTLYEEHKTSFYRIYTPMWEAVKSTTHLTTDEKYAWIQSMLEAKPNKKDTMNTRKVRMTYSLQGNVENYCVVCDGKTVTTLEQVFDVMLMAHQKLGHAHDV